MIAITMLQCTAVQVGVPIEKLFDKLYNLHIIKGDIICSRDTPVGYLRSKEETKIQFVRFVIWLSFVRTQTFSE